MRQEVNFFRGDGKPPQLFLGLDWMFRASLGVVAIFGLITGTQWYFGHSLAEQVDAAQLEVAQLEDSFKSLQVAYPQPKPDLVAIAEADRLQRRVDGLQSLLTRLAGDDWVLRGGFVAYFEGLARHAVADVWLTDIQFTSGGKHMNLAGTALDSAKIPAWVQGLGGEPAFKTKTFSDLSIARPQQHPGQVNFVLRSQALKQAGKDG